MSTIVVCVPWLVLDRDLMHIQLRNSGLRISGHDSISLCAKKELMYMLLRFKMMYAHNIPILFPLLNVWSLYEFV
jgi:hypothetical protein